MNKPTNRKIYGILFLGLIIRLGFILFGAKLYFHRDNIFVSGDTQAWADCFQNLLEHGTYTLNASHEYGYFGRMPGYSFFIGIFYLLCGQHWSTAYPIIGWFQTIADLLNIYLIFKIILLAFKNSKQAMIGALLYCIYPFIIVWTPVVFSEWLSITLLLISIYFFVKKDQHFRWLWIGIFLGMGILNRPQLLLFIPFFLLILLLEENNIKLIIKNGAWFCFAILITYGIWPIRNYTNHKKIILTQDLRGVENWDEDVLAYLQYIYSVKSEWEPQFHEIINNKPFTFPKEALVVPGDSAKLARAVFLSQNCGKGFSYWYGYWKAPIKDSCCNGEIVSLFNTLREHQVEKNPVNYYLQVPLQNLAKGLFKFQLADATSPSAKIASLLFVFRSFLIWIGVLGCLLILKYKRDQSKIGLLSFLYFISLYITLCAGTIPQLRNIEIRYFLPADILLLIPASYCLAMLFNKLKFRGPI